MGELLLARARPDQADAIFSRLRVIAPDAETLCRHADPRSELESAGVGERCALLLDVAAELIREFGGEVPEHEDDLRLLPGVGDYVRRAVLTFAFGRRQVLVDRTTARIAGRIARHLDSRRFQIRLDLHRLAGPEGPNAEFNRALLDLGREVCRAADPRCHGCPLVQRCAHGREVSRQLVLATAEDREGVAA